MYEYRVDTYIMKSGFFGGTNFEKQNEVLEDYLNQMDEIGWSLISITSIPIDSKSFSFELVFRKKK